MTKYKSTGYDQLPLPTKEQKKQNFYLFIAIFIPLLSANIGFIVNDYRFFLHTIAFCVAYLLSRLFMFLTNSIIVTLGEAWLAVMTLIMIIFCAIFEVQYLFFNY